ncbi:MAG: glycosyltransferase family 4 protein [Nocardioides sp.]
MTRLHLAANQGQIGGGEVMLLRAAGAARDAGLDVTVIAPDDPDETLASARAAGFDVVAVPGEGRAGYARGLRRWDRDRHGVLWCHGLLPALATAGRPGRLVHLHQLPTGAAQRLSLAVARRRALAVLVPSAFLAHRVPGSRVFANWTDPPARPRAAPTPGRNPVLGFLGRHSQDKGLDVLADAIALLGTGTGDDPRLLAAGDDRFVPEPQRRAVATALARIAGRVDLPGWIERTDFFDAVDLVVVPSVFAESFGLAVAEAMAARVPFVVTDAGALLEVAGPGHPWVARAGDAVALAGVLAEALRADLAADLDQARARWEREYSPAAGLLRVASLLAELGLPVTEPGS